MTKRSKKSSAAAKHPNHQTTAVTATDISRVSAARQSASRYGLRYIDSTDNTGVDAKLNGVDYLIQCSPEHTALIDRHSTHGPIILDYATGSLRHRQRFGGGKGQPLAKALGLKAKQTPNFVLDATAGYGKDAFVIASLGCPVLLVERSPVMCCLVEQALLLAGRDSVTETISSRMVLVNEDSTIFLQMLKNAHTQISSQQNKQINKFPDDPVLHGINNQPATWHFSRPDVIYLDPMYPLTEKSAKVKKDMQTLHRLIGPDIANESLLSTALECTRKQVVVKRPKNAAPFANQEPHRHISSPNTRYDIYLTDR